MGQSISVMMYGVRIPDGVEIESLREKWEEIVASRVDAFRAKLDAKANRWNWGIARQAYVPTCPSPDDAEPDDLIGFYVCQGDDDSYSSHQFPAMTLAEMRQHKSMAKIIKRCRRRWSRFARWAQTHGVEFGKARIWRTRTEVA